MKPLLNIDDITEFDDVEDNGIYTSKRALFSASIGSLQLGYNLTILHPAKRNARSTSTMLRRRCS